VNTLMDLPDVGCIYLLIRRQKSNPAQKRFEKLVEESPVFDPLYERHGQNLLQFINQRVRVIEGDVTQPGLGLDFEVVQSLRPKLDLIVNSSGLTDFNPDLRDALSTNVDAAVNVLELFANQTMPVCFISPLAMWPGHAMARKRNSPHGLHPDRHARFRCRTRMEGIASSGGRNRASCWRGRGYR